MHDRTIEQQHNLWLLAAAAAPIAHYAGCGWFPGVLAALAVSLLMLLPLSWEGLPRAIAVPEILWFGIVTGVLLKNSAAYWPSEDQMTAPLILLGLAILTNETSAPRIGAVLALCMTLLAVPMAIAGAGKIKLEWMKPAFGQAAYGLVPALLFQTLPAIRKNGKGKRALSIAALVLAVTILVQGTISIGTAASAEAPFYQTARTLGHLEPIAAAAITLGWYSMAIALIQSAHACAAESGIRREKVNVLVLGTSAAAVLFHEQPDESILMILSVFFWVVIPFFNKMKKVKKVLDK